MTATIAPADVGQVRGEQPGMWMSAIEREIVRVIGVEKAAKPKGHVKGAIVADRMGEPHGPKIKTLLANLVERGILAWSEEDGYTLAALDPTNRKRD